MRHWIDTNDVQDIALGAALLGTGGGGNVRLGSMKLRRLMALGRLVEVISVDEIALDAVGVAISGMGAPTIDVEKVPNGYEGANAVRALERYLGTSFSFLVVGEVGGANALEALSVGAMLDLPVVDADPMGRAFPELEMDTFMIHGVSPSPVGLADAHGTVAVLADLDGPLRAEKYGRALTTVMGGSAALAMPVVRGRDVRDFAVMGSLSLAAHLGRLMGEQHSLQGIHEALRRSGHNVVQPAEGKIVDLERHTQGSFARGRVTIQNGDRTFVILLQNEFLALLEGESVLVSVPDLITLVDQESGRPISTDQLRYGMRVAVLAFPAPEQLKSARALRVVGPQAFGYSFPFTPLPGQYPRGPWFAGH